MVSNASILSRLPRNQGLAGLPRQSPDLDLPLLEYVCTLLRLVAKLTSVM